MYFFHGELTFILPNRILYSLKSTKNECRHNAICKERRHLLSASLIIAKLSSLVKKAAPGTTVTVSFEAFTRSGSTCGTCTFSPWHKPSRLRTLSWRVPPFRLAWLEADCNTLGGGNISVIESKHQLRPGPADLPLFVEN